MKGAAIGVRMHSGWGALVAVSINAGTVEVIDRRRIAVMDSLISGAKQPYHFAENLKLPEAEKFLHKCFTASHRLASVALGELLSELRARQYSVVGSAVVLASGCPLPPLEKILAAHALIHAAEGEFFREVIRKACEELDLLVTGIRERDLGESLRSAFGAEAARRMHEHVAGLGRTLGPPWTMDQKTAALAALIVLATNKGAPPNRHSRKAGAR